MALGGGQHFQPPRLMPSINRGSYFLLTETVTVNCLVKSIYRGDFSNSTVSVNFINRGGFPNATASVNRLTEAVTL